MRANLIVAPMLLTALALLCSCTLTRGSVVVVGKARPKVDPSQVKLYVEPPKKFDKIAIVSSDARNAFASQQNLSNNAIDRLKREAAKVGANGILFEGIGNFQAGATGVAAVTPGSPLITGASSQVLGKEARGWAIFVIEE